MTNKELKLSNKRLLRLRSIIGLDTKEGREIVIAINSKMKKNNLKIKENDKNTFPDLDSNYFVKIFYKYLYK